MVSEIFSIEEELSVDQYWLYVVLHSTSLETAKNLPYLNKDNLNLLIYSKNSIMKKLLMLALVCTLATGTFANNHKPKKQKHIKQCTQQTCTPDCKEKGCCIKTACVKA